MRKPLLGYICCNRILDTGRNAQVVTAQYLDGTVPFIDVNPILIPSVPEYADPAHYSEILDGFLLTGSPSNIHPENYGEGNEDAVGPFDFARDNIAFKMVDAMLAAKKPVFAICRGFQELNVYFGGTIARDLSAEGRELKHHAPENVGFDEMFDHTHDVELFGILKEILGKSRTKVNSVHFQGVGKLGAELEILAQAPDGVVEAFYSEARGAPVFALQWHPEWDVRTNEDSQKIFAKMGEILRNSMKG